MSNERFWTGWLLFASAATAAMGATMALLAALPGAPGLVDLVPAMFWPDPAGGAADGDVARFAMGVAGGIMAGWGVALWLMARRAALRAEPAVWRAAALGLLVWFVVDGAASVATGAVLNLGGNVGFLALLLPPLMAFGWGGAVSDAGRGSTRTPAPSPTA